ncbi:MAG: MaoC family dehydratase N-terminal domain-containing protein [Actinobacteria bacterium]|nr:MaoC family dehydratase N-terminal domain-containing protein [Actinomycetota bacterium]
MALPPLENLAPGKVGRAGGRRTATVDLEQARAYAAATNDPNPAYAEGRYAPPVFGVVPTWDSLIAALDELIPAELKPMLLHAEQDMHFHQPLVPGMELTTEAASHSVRVARSGTRLTIRGLSKDDEGRPVLEQFSTMFVRGMSGLEDAGDDRPDHSFPDEARLRPVAEVLRTVDLDQTFRYRDASGDTNRIHVDEEFARSVKLPGIILHGLCTMAMCGSAVIDQVAGGDPARLARLAVRFSRPAFPGNDLVVSLFDAGSTGVNGRDGRAVYAFEAASGGKLVVRDGRAEVRN